MPRVKQRKEDEKEDRVRRTIKGYEDGSFKSIGDAATAFSVPPSTLAHRIIGRRTRREAHEADQLFTPAEERAIGKWILHLDDLGFPPRLDIVHQYLDYLALPKRRQEQTDAIADGRDARSIPDGIGEHFLTRFVKVR